MEISNRSLVIDTSHARYIGAAEDGVEDIVRSPHQFNRPLSNYADKSRCVHPPIRRRLHIDDFNNKAYQIYDLSSVMVPRTSMEVSGTDPWNGFVEEEDDDDSADFSWEEEDDGTLIAPKLEPVDDVNMADLSSPTETVEPNDAAAAAASKPNEPSASGKPPKKGRGRPRKHPVPDPDTASKIAKGRSKTGCFTCRRRKKKCDERKPHCRNCEKNSVDCEGYPVKTVWKSGKEKRAEEARLRRAGSVSLPKIQLPFLINGVETEGDRIFFYHYSERLSIKFTLEKDGETAFRNILLPMAQQHSGLMHSILALSSKHLDYTSAYGRQLLREHPGINVKALEERSQYHQDAAYRELRNDSTVSPTTYAQMLCFVLQTLFDPSPSGQHRLHLHSYTKLIRDNPPEDAESMKFIHEFFEYHISADHLVYYPQDHTQYISNTEDWSFDSTILEPSAVRMLGVNDGLFMWFPKITNIRDQIRRNMRMGIDPIFDYSTLHAAIEIDAGIREWVPTGDCRHAMGMIYRQMMWIYLWRTVYPPQATNWKSDPRITNAVEDGIKLLKDVGPRDKSLTLALLPTFVIGCAAFEEHQREPIRETIETISQYMECKNTGTTLRVLEEVWRLMDAKDKRSWDWQEIMYDMGMDFLAT